YLVLGVGESGDHLANLGAQKDSLAGRPEFKPLARFADRRLTSIGYASNALQTKLAMTDKDLNNLVAAARQALPQLGLTQAELARIIKDLDGLAKDLKQYLPRPGASLTFSFLTNRGQETYAYDWGEFPRVDGSKPLTLLNHVGGSPLVATVGRSKVSPADYQLLVKWIKVANGYAEEFLVPKLEADQKEKYEKFVKVAHPLLKRL